MKRFSKFLTVLLVVSMILPGIAQAAPVLTAETSAVQRLAGKGREETAVAASEMAYKDGAGNVVLVGYNGEVDALTGTLLANAKKAPLLITNQASLTETTKKEIARLKAKNVYILGGEKVVSKEVEIELKALKYNVKRIEGADREKTAIAVAKEVGGTINHVFLAKGYDIYADALSVGPVSAIKNMPVFLTNTNSMTPATIQAMKDLGVKEVTIVGGEKTVTKKVEDQLKGIKINRISGDDREKTALAVADKFFPSTETSILASGYTFADALVGGYIGAKMNAPILLTNTNLISAETEEFIADNSLKIYVLGGEKVVSDKVLKKIEAAVKAEKASDITVNETIKLNRNYNSVKVTANNIVVDLGGKTVKELTVSANDTTIKNGTVIKLNIEKTVVNVILEDIVDTEDSEHTFAGGGAKSIVLKGNTNLRGLVEVTSTTPIQIRAEGLNAGQGVTGTLIINTGAPVTIGVPVNEVEVQKENTSIKINAEVKKVNALAKTEITMGKDVKAPILEKAKDVEASAKDNNGKVEDFVVNDKLKPTEPVKPVEPTPGGGGVVKVSAISVDKDELTLTVGATETLTVTVTVTPDTEANRAVTWTSNKPSVATVDANGKITAVGVGEAVITVTSVKDNSRTATVAVTVPAAPVDETKAVATDKAELEAALANDAVTEITVDGTLGSTDKYTIYNVDRAVSIQGADGAKVYGSFIVKADDVTIDNLAIQNKGDLTGESSNNRGGIYVFAEKVTLTNNTITNGLGDKAGLSNAIQIMSPTANNPLSNYTITGNKLIGHDNEVPNWSSSGIVIAQGYKPGSIGQDVLSITATESDYTNLLNNNTFTNNKINVTHQDWTTGLEGGPVLYPYPVSVDEE